MAGVAGQHGRTERFVQRAVRSGDLPALRLVGRLTLVDDLAATAWARSLAPGRRWSSEVREAAVDLLSTGRTDRLSSSERSRLRARLRGMTSSAIAHASGGLGGWARYRVTVVPDLPRVGPSAVDQTGLGIVPGPGWVTFVETVDLDVLEFEHDVILDGDGNLGVVERQGGTDSRVARVLLDCYLVGDARLFAAAGSELERRAHDL